MTDEQFEDVRESVEYHREHGGYSAHNPPGARFCRCASCRLVRTFDALVAAARTDAVDPIIRGETELAREP